ncbi:efflux transporter, RND family, MFP subunit [Collimonas arenae]|uniref:Efflux transporter, RND family, MFP subunit n=1 Tax=Collimonas arenae TaxID=279058 RepID=A0A127PUX1_9BURK|nr:efflux RND transporter periplasmic adaptor subunit [Collimonas arenae]AMP01534.1 efflux transporter, RND family, MFP subunit [Collimonas arenae]AMP11428.1 efflux transporter, RND family, MFP subunit [Collimonas arenae]
MKKPSLKQTASVGVIVVLGAIGLWATTANHAKTTDKSAASADAKPKASLTVTTTKPQSADWPMSFTANGSVAAWQEAIVGSELGGIQLAEVRVNVGDVVKRGQVLARFTSESVAAQVAQQKAAVEEARAALAEAQSNAERAHTLANSGALSAQQTTQYEIAERSTKARLLSAQASLDMQEIRLRQTQVVAPDDGVISSRTATVGAVASQGQELFRLIRQNRLEWRAEVNATDLLQIKPGQAVKLHVTNGVTVDGKVRMIAPTADPVTRNALVYVDLPVPGNAHAGMFGTGEFVLGHAEALTLPQSAVVMRDGFSYVYQLGKDDKVTQTKITLGRRVGDRIEVTSGASSITKDMTLVSQGAGFLADGDTVSVVPSATATPVSAPVVKPAAKPAVVNAAPLAMK